MIIQGLTASTCRLQFFVGCRQALQDNLGEVVFFEVFEVDGCHLKVGFAFHEGSLNGNDIAVVWRVGGYLGSESLYRLCFRCRAVASSEDFHWNLPGAETWEAYGLAEFGEAFRDALLKLGCRDSHNVLFDWTLGRYFRRWFNGRGRWHGCFELVGNGDPQILACASGGPAGMKDAGMPVEAVWAALHVSFAAITIAALAVYLLAPMPRQG